MPAAPTLRLALAQINPTVGDVEGNARLASESIAAAKAGGAQLVVLPELCLSGYPPEDLVLRRDFLDSIGDAIHSLAAEVEGITALVGFPERIDRPEEERRNPIIDAVAPPAHNSLAVLADGEVTGVYRKTHLPNYAIFDERRYFEPGPEPLVIDVDGVVVGLTICEDIWIPGSPESDEAAAGARLIVNASGSPYARGKGAARERMVAERARTYGIPFALCNTVGGQDELVFDGQSVVVSAEGETIARGAQFEPELVVCDVPLSGERAPNPVLAEPLSEEAEVYAALTLGVRDYVEQERLRRGRSGPLGRHRLGPGRPGGHRCRRPRSRALRRNAVPPLQRGDAGRRPRDRAQRRRRADRDPDRRADERVRARPR